MDLRRGNFKKVLCKCRLPLKALRSRFDTPESGIKRVAVRFARIGGARRRKSPLIFSEAQKRCVRVISESGTGRKTVLSGATYPSCNAQ
jgi:hypothetical protein